MPRNRRPSFLTRQKEQARKARANEKREAKRAKRKARTTDEETGSGSGPAEVGGGVEADQITTGG